MEEGTAPDQEPTKNPSKTKGFLKSIGIGILASLAKARQKMRERKENKQQQQTTNRMIDAVQGVKTATSPLLFIFIITAGLVALADASLFITPAGWANARILLHINLLLFASVLFMGDDAFFVSIGKFFLIFALALGSIYIMNGISWILTKLLVPFFGIMPNLGNGLFSFFGGIAAFVFIPIWLHYAFIQTIRPKGIIIKIIEVIFYAIIIIVAITALAKSGIFEQANLSQVISQDLSPEAKALTQGIKQDVQEGVPSLFQKVRDSISTMITGVVRQSVGEDIYNSKVDKNKEEPLGVYIQNLKPSSELFFEGDPVTVWGTLKARTLDSDNPIKVSVSCSADTGLTSQFMSSGDDPTLYRLKGDTNPNNDTNEITFDIATFELRDIDCVLPAGELLHGLRPVHFSAKFNFQTMAYQKAYFMDEETLRTLRREGIDPLNQYGITDTNPITVHSNGPVALGMQLTSSLTGIKENSDFRLSLSLNNRWDGKIKTINKVILKIPESMELYGCDADFKKRPCETNKSNECEEGKYQFVYELMSPQLSEQLKSIKQVKSFNCHVKIKDITATLGNVPISTHYFKSLVEYDYELEKSVSVNIKDDPDVEIESVAQLYFTENTNYDYLKSDSGYKPKQSDEDRIRSIISKWGEYIDEAYLKYPKVPKSFIIGFMRLESGGNPYAISWAGAVGLIQLMPHTAFDAYQKATGKKLLGCPFLDPSDQLTDDNCNRKSGISWTDYGTALRTNFPESQRSSLVSRDVRFDPRLNILMSVAHLDSLRQTYSQGENVDWYKVAVAYNRGAGTVNRWIEKGKWAEWEKSQYRCGDPTCKKFGNDAGNDILTIAAQNYGANVIAYSRLADTILGSGVFSSSSKPFVESTGNYAWPVSSKLITQCYTTTAGIDNYAHKAIDIESSEGSEVYAISSGRVVNICGKPTKNCYGESCSLINGDCADMGNYVEIITNTNIYYRVIHLKEEKVIKGQLVNKGDVIGLSGNTGNSAGPHLHLDIYTKSSDKYSTAFNPLCIYDYPLLETLRLGPDSSCDSFRMELNEDIFNVNSEIFKAQCKSTPGTAVSTIWS